MARRRRSAAAEILDPLVIPPVERMTDPDPEWLRAHPLVAARLRYLPAPYSDEIVRFIWLRSGEQVAGFENHGRGLYYGFVFDVDIFCEFTSAVLDFVFNDVGAELISFETAGIDSGANVNARRLGRRMAGGPQWVWQLWKSDWATVRQETRS